MMIVVTGGAGNGKSVFAESLMQDGPTPRNYVATMIPYGGEGEARILRHRAMRAGKGFIAHEQYRDIDVMELEPHGTVLLECLCNLTANEMFDDAGVERDNDYVYGKILRGLGVMAGRCERLIIVTNDVGSDAESYSDSTIRYAALLGGINRAVCGMADLVFEMVCGIPLAIKGELL